MSIFPPSGGLGVLALPSSASSIAALWFEMFLTVFDEGYLI